MRLRLLGIWSDIRASYWFVPTVMALAAALLSMLMISLDERVSPKWVSGLRWLYLNQPDGARSLLSTVAGSMITVAGVAFSIVMVVLSLTSSQFGPRLLRNFMRDTGNQIVLGTFVATFIYCLMVLRTVRTGEGSTSAFVPHLSVALAVVLAALSIGVFIYFIHHTAESIQVSNIIARISHSLETMVMKRYPERPIFPAALGRALEESDAEGALPDSFDDLSLVLVTRGGYLQHINEEGLLDFAKKHDVIFKLTRQPGEFLTRGSPLVQVWPNAPYDDAFKEALRNQFVLGAHRTQTQDVDFLFDQLVEVGLRALSPGINDPFTALMCIDRIGEGLSLLGERELPSPYRFDDEGRLRVVASTLSTPEMVARTLGPFRRYGEDSLLVLTHLLFTLKTLAKLTDDPWFRSALLHEAKLIKKSGCQKLVAEDCETLTRAYVEATNLEA